MTKSGKLDSNEGHLAQAWAASRRRPMFWGWILQGLGLISSFAVPFLYKYFQDSGIVSEELIGSWWGYLMDFNVLAMYLQLGLVFYLALDRFLWIREQSSVFDSADRRNNFWQHYRTEFQSAWHIVGLLMIPSVVIGLLYWIPAGMFDTYSRIGLFNDFVNILMMIIVNVLNFVQILFVIAGLSLFINRLGILRCAALGILINLLADKLDRYLSFKLQLLATDNIGFNAANPNVLEQGMVYMIYLGSLLVHAMIFGAIFWLLSSNRRNTRHTVKMYPR